MTRPTSTPIEWRLHQQFPDLQESQLLDGKYRLWKAYLKPSGEYAYGLKDLTLGPREIVIFYTRTFALLRCLSRRYKDIPETCAALASITSDEDWEEIND